MGVQNHFLIHSQVVRAGSVIRFTTAGSYNVTEQEDPLVVSERSVDCEGFISAGQNKTCTITNTVRGNGNTVVPIFVTVNNIGGGTRNASDFTPRASGPSNPNPPLRSSFMGCVPSNPSIECYVVLTRNLGSYNVTEDIVPNYRTTLSQGCRGNTNITSDNPAAPCNIVNVYSGTGAPAAPTMGIVKVIKRVVNDDGGTNRASDFRIRVTSENSPPVNFRGAPTPGMDVMVNPGAFSVTEQIDSRYDTTTTLDGRLQQCLGTIRAGQTVTCTITNNDKPTAFLRVIKTVVNNDGANKRPSDFNIKVFGNNPSDSSFPGESYPGDIIRIGPGDYRVRENQDARYVTTYSLQCSGYHTRGTDKDLHNIEQRQAIRFTACYCECKE